MDDLTKPKPILRLTQLIRSLWSTQCEQCPSWHFPLILSLLLWYPLWFPSFLCLHPIILPLLPLFLLTHYSLHVYNPKDHITWERTSWKSGGERALSG